MKKVEIKSKQRVFDDVFKIDETRLCYERFDGEMSQPIRQLTFERGDSVAAILFHTDINGLILIKQFRYATYQKGPGWIIETIAGILEAGETPEAAIQREILEEVGYNVESLTHISTFYVSPGGTSERIILYYAQVGSADKVAVGGGLATEQEDIEILEYPLSQVWTMLDAGHIVDAKTLVALLWLKNKLRV